MGVEFKPLKLTPQTSSLFGAYYSAKNEKVKNKVEEKEITPEEIDYSDNNPKLKEKEIKWVYIR